MAHPQPPTPTPNNAQLQAPPRPSQARHTSVAPGAAPTARTITEVATSTGAASAPSPATAACTFDDAFAAVDGARLVQAALAALPNQAYARALVAPCGGAALASLLAAQRIVAIDASRPLLAKAQRRLAQRPDRARFHLWHGALTELPTPVAGHAFDLLVLDLLRPELAGLSAAALRLAVHEQLGTGGVLLVLAPQGRPADEFAYTLLHAETQALGGHKLSWRCYWR